jgi:CubicO group peptidase (beta-lactamase class C family)
MWDPGAVASSADQYGSAVDRIAAEHRFSGVVRVDVDGDVVAQRAYGLADRSHGIPNAADTRFAVASGSKGFTALVAMSLVEDGTLALDATARSLLGDDLPLVDDRVTVEHLLAHRSGMGDYVDEDEHDDANGYVLSVPVHELASTEDYLRALDGHPQKFEPGTAFSYSNGGFVVLALLAERASGTPFHDLVRQRVCEPAGMVDTAYLRSDELPGGAALGYLDDGGLRTNVLHLPVRGSGDGGAYTTAADVHAFWDALFAGRLVEQATLDQMLEPRSEPIDTGLRYGLGFWRYPSGAVSVHGFDAGVGFVTSTDPDRRWTYTVLCNQTRGAWPTSQGLDDLLAGLSRR